MIVYDSAGVYIDQAGDDPREGAARCDAIVKALFAAMLKAASNAGISEYDLDDGQTKIKTAYRNPAEIERSISAFLKIKQYYLNQINGNVVRLVDGKNFTRYNNGRY